MMLFHWIIQSLGTTLSAYIPLNLKYRISQIQLCLLHVLIYTWHWQLVVVVSETRDKIISIFHCELSITMKQIFSSTYIWSIHHSVDLVLPVLLFRNICVTDDTGCFTFVIVTILFFFSPSRPFTEFVKLVTRRVPLVWYMRVLSRI